MNDIIEAMWEVRYRRITEIDALIKSLIHRSGILHAYAKKHCGEDGTPSLRSERAIILMLEITEQLLAYLVLRDIILQATHNESGVFDVQKFGDAYDE